MRSRLLCCIIWALINAVCAIETKAESDGVNQERLMAPLDAQSTSSNVTFWNNLETPPILAIAALQLITIFIIAIVASVMFSLCSKIRTIRVDLEEVQQKPTQTALSQDTLDHIHNKKAIKSLRTKAGFEEEQIWIEETSNVSPFVSYSSIKSYTSV